jgi:dTDP-4-amino-4,6-dideoxygalactose transaminase
MRSSSEAITYQISPVIIPSFTYVATAEVIGLLKLKPIMVDVDPNTFNITRANIENAIGPKTRAIVPVHLFGQCADMEPILLLAKEYNLYVIEDTAQALGAVYNYTDGTKKQAGTMGHIGCTSFFPSKNLGCYGDGGAIFTFDQLLAQKIKMIANHGQVKKYVHKFIGVNSRLDTIQAAILDIKLSYLNTYNKLRNEAANRYDVNLSGIAGLRIPRRSKNSSHVFHQYTLILHDTNRDALHQHLL